MLDEYNSDDEKYKDESDDEEEVDSEEHITKVFMRSHTSCVHVIKSCNSRATEMLINGNREKKFLVKNGMTGSI